MDSKSIGLCPQGFKSPRCRCMRVCRLLASGLRRALQGGVDSNGLKSHSCHLLNRVFLKSRTPTDKPCVYVCAFTTLHSGVAQWLACWAHNPKVHGSRPCSAIARKLCFAPPQQTGARRRIYEHLQQTLFLAWTNFYVSPKMA